MAEQGSVDPYVEIERKFLVRDRTILDGLNGTSLAQGYLVSQRDVSLRVRISGSESSMLTLKGERVGMTRTELEFEIPLQAGLAMLNLCEPHVVTKMRFPLIFEDQLWQIDVFQDQNHGLVLAEIELSSTDENVSVPAWCGREVTADERYYNEYLARHPFEQW